MMAADDKPVTEEEDKDSHKGPHMPNNIIIIRFLDTAVLNQLVLVDVEL